MRFSKEVEVLLIECKKTAERLKNDYIGLRHFLLVYNKFSYNNSFDFKVTLSEIKEIIKNTKGFKFNKGKKDSFPLTIDFEKALKSSPFHAWICSDIEVYPKHIYLYMYVMENNKNDYLSILNEWGISITKIKKVMIDMHFNKMMRQLGITRIFMIFI